MCNNCNQNNCNECTQEVHICNQCPPETCDCAVRLSTDCLTYDQDNIECNSVVVVAKNTILSDALNQIVSWSCTKFSELANYLRIVNVGVGASIYAGDNLIGEKKIRKLKSTNGSVTITQGTDDINFSVTVNDGSETKVTQGTNVTITGNGTIATPYVVNSIDTNTTYTATNVGTGANVYKDSTGTQFNFRKINTSNSGGGEEILKAQVENTNDISVIAKTLSSTSLNITSTTDGISIEVPAVSDIPALIVNSAYTGDEELGTASKPFKTIQGALDAYVGTGGKGTILDPTAPELVGSVISIQKGSGEYGFEGDFNYKDVSISLEEGTRISHLDTSVSDWLIDTTVFDNTATITINIDLKKNSALFCYKNGFRNRGTLIGTSNFQISQIINLTGTGLFSQNVDNNINEIYTLIDSGSSNTVGYNNDGNLTFNISDIDMSAINQRVLDIGGNSRLMFDSVFLTSNNTPATINPIFKSFNLNGGEVTIDNSTIIIRGGVRNGGIYLLNSGTFTPKLLMNSCLLVGTPMAYFKNTGTAFVDISLTGLTTRLFGVTNIIETAHVLPSRLNAVLRNCVFENGLIPDNVDLTYGNTISVINTIGADLVESLRTYTSKAAAATAGLAQGAKFLNKNDVTAGAFVVGLEYKILTTGTTDFTLIGASANTVGLYFTASGTGTGTGTASLIRVDIVI